MPLHNPTITATDYANEIKGWPPVVQPDADLDALNLWWDKVGTPTTAPTVVDVAGEGITETYELAIKVVTDANSEGMEQTWTFADEPRIKSGRTLSALVAIWSVGGVQVLARLRNSDGTTTDALYATAAAWTLVEIPNHTLAGTSCSLRILTVAAGTFYVVPLGVCIGPMAVALPPRGLRYVDSNMSADLVNADPGAAWTDVDCTANTSPLTVSVEFYMQYTNSTTTAKGVSVRRNGDTITYIWRFVIRAPTTGVIYGGRGTVWLDDNNIFEYIGSDLVADTETVTIRLLGWWEWA